MPTAKIPNRPPKLKRKRLTLIGLSIQPTQTTRNPTAAITAKGGLIAKTRKPEAP